MKVVFSAPYWNPVRIDAEWSQVSGGCTVGYVLRSIGRWSVVEVDLTMRSCLLVYCGKVSRMVVVLLNDN
jgi:hypothetical protein